VDYDEHGGSKLLRTVDTPTQIYTPSHVRRQTPHI